MMMVMMVVMMMVMMVVMVVVMMVVVVMAMVLVNPPQWPGCHPLQWMGMGNTGHKLQKISIDVIPKAKFDRNSFEKNFLPLLEMQ